MHDCGFAYRAFLYTQNDYTFHKQTNFNLMQEWYFAPSITDHEIKVTSSYTTIYKVYIEWDKAGYSEWRINVMCMFITQLCDYFCDEINVETLCICLRDKRLLVLLERLVLPKFKSNKPCIHRNTK